MRDDTEISVQKDGKGVTQTLKGLDLGTFHISDEMYVNKDSHLLICFFQEAITVLIQE